MTKRFWKILPAILFTMGIFGTGSFAGPQSLSFTKTPYLLRIQSTSLTIAWKTNVPARARVYVGRTTDYEHETLEITTERDSQQVDIARLWPGTVYHLKVTVFAGGEEISTADWMVITASHPESTGEMAVFFTKSVDTTLALYRPAKGNQEPYRALVERLNAAHYSIDFCAYSLSLTEISDALVAAKNRGVHIRFIYDNGHHQSAVQDLRNAGIRVIDDAFGVLNDGRGLQHNKFVIIDARDTTSFSDDWVWTGSYNFTWQATSENAENAVLIQDESLAKIYTMEFNEMWGSVTDSPNADSARFSWRKTDNTPHETNVNGMRVEAYFSPGDGVQEKIERAIATASDNIEFAILSFTRWGIRDALIDRFQQGVAVHGIFDRSEQGNAYSQYGKLKSAGVDVLYYGESGTLHHKYMIIDGHTHSDPQVETGSYNYSSSAENKNNENILILHSPVVADYFWQEFAARYHNSGGQAPLTTAVKESFPRSASPQNFFLREPFPNPVRLNDRQPVEIWLRVNRTLEQNLSLSIFNLLGQRVYAFHGNFSHPGLYRLVWNRETFGSGHLSAGVYFAKAQSGRKIVTRKLTIIR